MRNGKRTIPHKILVSKFNPSKNALKLLAKEYCEGLK
jgi:hypothetical protein